MCIVGGAGGAGGAGVAEGPTLCTARSVSPAATPGLSGRAGGQSSFSRNEPELQQDTQRPSGPRGVTMMAAPRFREGADLSLPCLPALGKAWPKRRLRFLNSPTPRPFPDPLSALPSPPACTPISSKPPCPPGRLVEGGVQDRCLEMGFPMVQSVCIHSVSLYPDTSRPGHI